MTNSGNHPHIEFGPAYTGHFLSLYLERTVGLGTFFNKFLSFAEGLQYPFQPLLIRSELER